MALFAKKHSQYAAAKIFNVARRRIFDWMRQIPKLEELIAKGHMKKMTGRGPKNRDIDQALYNWYCERQDTILTVYNTRKTNELSSTRFRTLDGDTGEFIGFTGIVLFFYNALK